MSASTMTTPAFALAAEYQVRYTCLDSYGDQAVGSDPLDGIAEAHMECDRILAYQEQYGLPKDAAIWWRPGVGHEWKRWAALTEQAVTR